MFRNLSRWTAALTLTVGVAVAAWAAADANGKWTWKQMGQQGEVTMTMELKQDGEKLTGNVTRGDMKTDISDGKITKENDLSFNVVREFNGNQFKQAYKGKLDGDTIKGTITVNFNGQDRTRDWMATRVK